MFYALFVEGMPFDSSDVELLLSEYLRPYKHGHIQVESIRA